jgi:hypothetical protein
MTNHDMNIRSRYYKKDDECKPITLIMRQYYPNRKEYYQLNKERIKARLREKYANDPEYKAKQLETRRKNYMRNKAEQLSSQK